MAQDWIEYQRVSRSSERLYYRELVGVLAYCLRHDVVDPLRFHIRRWFAKGAPIDLQGQGAPESSLRIVVRQVALAIPSLRAFHAECRLWLADPYVRCRSDLERAKLRYDLRRIQNPKPYQEGWVPWNLLLWAPKGTPYAAFLRKGFEVTYRRGGGTTARMA
jgi:hypothetical protein